MYYLRLTNIKYRKNSFTRVETTQAVIQAKHQIFTL